LWVVADLVVFDKAPFQVSETGWGEFVIGIRIQFVLEASEKPLNLSHSLKLHHWGPPIEGTLPVIDPATVTESVPTTAAPTPAAAPVEEKAVEVPKVPQEPTATAEVKEGETVKGTPTETVKTETEVSTPVQSDPTVAVQPEVAETTTTHPPLPVSIATKLPVHSWQYDELVFSDPPAAFLEILNANPPTPLPAKFRRPKDQREREEGPKKKKGRPSVVNSRAQTQEPGVAGTPVPAGPVVGIPGELGSADVPLEFAKEMEIGEFNRLTDARLNIIDHMDKCRYVSLANV
jgi:YEATS domain-containing protein 4